MKIQPEKLIAGIDFGKKFSGNTVLCFIQNGKAEWLICPKNKDSDKFLFNHLTEVKPSAIFIDIPLSLPGVFWLGGNYQDYFYRESDRKVSGMSPMFLGGLTARGIRLKDSLLKEDLACYEVYPGYLARELGLKQKGYREVKSYLPEMEKIVKQYCPLDFPENSLETWHQLDALLAGLSGMRYFNDRYLSFGNPEEGLILV